MMLSIDGTVPSSATDDASSIQRRLAGGMSGPEDGAGDVGAAQTEATVVVVAVVFVVRQRRGVTNTVGWRPTDGIAAKGRARARHAGRRRADDAERTV